MAFTRKNTTNRKIETPLPAVLEKYGSKFHLLARTGQIVIYSRTKPGTKVKEHFEVMITYVDKNGKEHMPGSSLWGTRGWTFPTYEKALAKRAELVEVYAGKHATV